MVVKGVKSRNHQVVGDIIDLASKYSRQGADEIVFYDITASPEGRRVDRSWINEVAKQINIPFCVAGGIQSIVDAEEILNFGADKISINTPAINTPKLINDLADKFGSQCVVVGIDSFQMNDQYNVYSYTGDPDKTKQTGKLTGEWLMEVQDRGAGEIVLNCMNQDGVRKGYDILQLSKMKKLSDVPIIASGGAGTKNHFVDVFLKSGVSGALAASVFHKNLIRITDLKTHLKNNNIEVRL